jgi:hypothetical protein
VIERERKMSNAVATDFIEAFHQGDHDSNPLSPPIKFVPERAFFFKRIWRADK